MKDPKYKIGDKVWMMNKNRPVQVEVAQVNTTTRETRDSKICYVDYECLLGNDFGSSVHYTGLSLLLGESKLFPSKQALIESL